MNLIAPNERMTSWLEQAWLQHYLDRKLDDDEVEWFEMYALDKPELIAAIDADSDLRDGMAAAGIAQADSRVTPIGRASPRSPRRAAPMLAWAASAVACVGLGWMMAMQLAPSAGSGAPNIIASPTRIVFDTMRGVEDAPQVYPGLPNSEYLLIEVGLPSDASNVTLRIRGREHQSLALTSEGFATFLIQVSTVVGESPSAIEFVSQGRQYTRVIRIGKTVTQGERK